MLQFEHRLSLLVIIFIYRQDAASEHSCSWKRESTKQGLTALLLVQLDPHLTHVIYKFRHATRAHRIPTIRRRPRRLIVVEPDVLLQRERLFKALVHVVGYA